MPKARGGLGRGIGAIFAENSVDQTGVTQLPLSEIEPNRDQPRKQFDPAGLAELADSIKQHGILQPLVVRPLPEGGYQLVAGERRWRAARMAGLSQAPVVVKELDDAQVLELALIENLQREDLNPMEEAAGYQELMDRFGLTQEQVSAKVGKSRPVVTNALRLLGLPEPVRALLEAGKLSAGHGRALAGLEEAEPICQIAQEAVKKNLSVRQVEALVRRLKQQKQPPRPQTAWDNRYFTEVQLALSQTLSRKVKVEGSEGKGRLILEFYSEEDLKHLAALLGERAE